MSDYKKYLREFKDTYFKIGVANRYVFRDHVLKVYDEFAIKNGYPTSDKYSKMAFVRDLKIAFNEGLTDNYVQLAFVQSVGVSNFKNKMGISAKVFNNVDWKSLNLSDNCIDGEYIYNSYQNRAGDFGTFSRKTQYLDAILDFKNCTTPEGLDAYFSWMDQINFGDQSFSANKNLYFQNHMILKLVTPMHYDIQDIKKEILYLKTEIQEIKSQNLKIINLLEEIKKNTSIS